MTGEELKICLVDDNQIFREGLKFFIHSFTSWKIIQEYSSGEDFNDEAGKKEIPDIVLMDYKLPGVDGITITKKYLSRFPEVKIIAVSMFAYQLLLKDFILAGFKGCIQKRRLYDQIIPAVESIMNGGSFFLEEY